MGLCVIRLVEVAYQHGRIYGCKKVGRVRRRAKEISRGWAWKWKVTFAICTTKWLKSAVQGRIWYTRPSILGAEQSCRCPDSFSLSRCSISSLARIQQRAQTQRMPWLQMHWRLAPPLSLQMACFFEMRNWLCKSHRGCSFCMLVQLPKSSRQGILPIES